jgi:glutathione S-transferase
MSGLTVYHIPVCPFSQRVEILLARKNMRDRVRFHVVDITEPRPAWLLEKTRGTTALPVLETDEGRILKESLVILRYFEEMFPDPPVARRDPYERAVERMLTTMERAFGNQGYRFVLNQDRARRDEHEQKMLDIYAQLDAFLREHAPGGPYLFEDFGWAEVVFTPLFMRFWFLEFYENFALPEDDRFARVKRWRDACLSHPDAQQVTREQIIKLYYDYARGAGNGGLLPGRTQSSFAFQPHWRDRPWPPADKYGPLATDRELGLTARPVSV